MFQNNAVDTTVINITCLVLVIRLDDNTSVT
jgi:hypothetical protein